MPSPMTRADTLWLAKCEADVQAALLDREVVDLRQRLAEAEQRRERARKCRCFLEDAWRDLAEPASTTGDH